MSILSERDHNSSSMLGVTMFGLVTLESTHIGVSIQMF